MSEIESDKAPEPVKDAPETREARAGQRIAAILKDEDCILIPTEDRIGTADPLTHLVRTGVAIRARRGSAG